MPRQKTYNIPHTFSSVCEHADYIQFQNACRDSGVAMNAVIIEAMRRFSARHTPQNSQISEWFGSTKIADMEGEPPSAHKLPPPFFADAAIWVDHVHGTRNIDELYRLRNQGTTIRNISQAAIDNLLRKTARTLREEVRRI